MSFFTFRNKKITLGIATIATLSLLSISQLHADTTASAGTGSSNASSLLAAIAQYTNGTLTAVTSTTNPVVTAIVTALTNLTSPDNATNPASPTPTLQNGFTSYITQTAASATAQAALQQQLIAPLFASFTTTNVPYANDLVFSSLMGTPTPYFNPDPRPKPSSIDSGLNYVKYASGLNVTHAVPDPSWTGSLQDQLNYTAYFATINAVQTFNGYVLSQLYEDVKNGVAAAQTTLINQASDPANWFATITTESIGAVLRQTLMYQSQSYIVLTQLLQTEKMLLAAQTMNNTLLVLSNQSNESFMLRKAVAKMPGG